ncbi:hypothetical protein Hanom_Chr12g01175471 [Helianthus anomalus]
MKVTNATSTIYPPRIKYYKHPPQLLINPQITTNPQDSFCCDTTFLFLLTFFTPGAFSSSLPLSLLLTSSALSSSPFLFTLSAGFKSLASFLNLKISPFAVASSFSSLFPFLSKFSRSFPNFIIIL